MRLIRSAFLLLVALAFSGAARAQSARWEPGDSALGNIVQLIFENCEPDGDPQLPVLPNASLTLTGRSSSVNMINGSVTQSLILTYFIQSRGGGALKIPTFTVTTNKGPVRVPAFDAGAPAATAAGVASARLLPAKPTVWAGEVFDLTYELKAARRNNPQINPTFDWNAAPLVAEEWSKPDVNEVVEDNQRQILVTFRTRAYVKAPNTVKLEAASHLLQIQTGSTSFGFLSQPRMEPISVTSDQPVVEVRALPAAPADFSGAVGEFKLTSKIVPQEATVSEPITWTLELSGTGNWPDIAGLPAREVSKDFQVVQPKAKRSPAEHKLFDATLSEDVVLVPTKAGTYTLGPLAFTFFNPKTGRYETLQVERTTVTIKPSTTPPAVANAAAGPDAGKSATESTGPAKPVTAPSAPNAIPRDPLLGHATAPRPLATAALVVWLLSPVACLLLFWFALAWRRAIRTDPLRPQREAEARLAAILAEMHGPGSDPVVAERLLRWQHDSAILWQIPHAAPAATALPEIEWSALWREADRALYGAKVSLPSDWLPRAEAALAAKHVPGFNPIRLFLPQNLLAFAAAATIALLLFPHGMRAVESAHPSTTPSPEAAYRAGDFATAEQAWRDAIKTQPTDWVARHDLSLALAQQDRHGEALAQAAAAFVQHPRDASVRWHFALTAEKAGFAPSPLLPFLKEGPASSIAALASPAEWQRYLIVAAYVVAVALGGLLYNAYGSRRRAVLWLAGAIGAGAALTGVVSIFGIVAFGETADVRAVVAQHGGTLRSIPTEADTMQKTSPLSPGSVALVDKTFLGWNRLVFANGQTGWVRQEDVVPLWR